MFELRAVVEPHVSGDTPRRSSSTCPAAHATARSRCSWSSRRRARPGSRSSSSSPERPAPEVHPRGRRRDAPADRKVSYEDLARARPVRVGAAVDSQEHLPRRERQRRAPRGVARERRAGRRDRDKEATRSLTSSSGPSRARAADERSLGRSCAPSPCATCSRASFGRPDLRPARVARRRRRSPLERTRSPPCESSPGACAPATPTRMRRSRIASRKSWGSGRQSARRGARLDRHVPLRGARAASPRGELVANGSSTRR
jgi:hypothetical protein